MATNISDRHQIVSRNYLFIQDLHTFSYFHPLLSRLMSEAFLIKLVLLDIWPEMFQDEQVLCVYIFALSV